MAAQPYRPTTSSSSFYTSPSFAQYVQVTDQALQNARDQMQRLQMQRDSLQDQLADVEQQILQLEQQWAGVANQAPRPSLAQALQARPDTRSAQQELNAYQNWGNTYR
jgi:predicted  nucleic acid-binding Zn-ribbon protein